MYSPLLCSLSQVCVATVPGVCFVPAQGGGVWCDGGHSSGMKAGPHHVGDLGDLGDLGVLNRLPDPSSSDGSLPGCVVSMYLLLVLFPLWYIWCRV